MRTMKILKYIFNTAAIAILTVSNISADEKIIFRHGVWTELTQKMNKTIKENNQEELIRLIQAGADVNQADGSGSTPLTRSAAEGKVALIEILLSHSADLEATDIFGETALGSALEHCQLKAIDILIKHGANVHYANDKALFDAVKGNCGPAIKLLAQKGLDVNREGYNHITPLASASEDAEDEAIEALLNLGANPNLGFVRGGIPSMHAYLIFTPYQAQQTDIVELYLRKGADVNSRVPNRSTPLMGASERSSVGILEVLLKHGAKVNDKDDFQETPLFYAQRNRNCGIHCLKLLLQEGADLKARDKYGNTAYEYAHAKRNKEQMAIMEKYGADKRVLSRSYLSGCWKGDDARGFTIQWGLNMDGRFTAYAVKMNDLIRYEGTWSRWGDFIVFQVAEAQSIEAGNKYISEHPFSMKLKIQNLTESEIDFKVSQVREQFTMRYDGDCEDWSIRNHCGLGGDGSWRLWLEGTAPGPNITVNSAAGKTVGITSDGTTTVVEKIKDWSLDYPKRPLKKGERFPYPSSPIE